MDADFFVECRFLSICVHLRSSVVDRFIWLGLLTVDGDELDEKQHELYQQCYYGRADRCGA